MKQYLYLSATPESLVASQLPPVEFGHYLSVGTRKRTRGQAIFFELDMEKMDIPVAYIHAKLVTYHDREPKRSVFLSIYRVVESISLDALKNLYLVTDDGKVLELEAAKYRASGKDIIHLYQQFNPITTRVASKLSPPEFIDASGIKSIPQIGQSPGLSCLICGCIEQVHVVGSSDS